MEAKFLEHLLNYRSFINNKIENNTKTFKVKNDLNKYGLCNSSDEQNIKSMLDQEFEKQKLGYYNHLGVEFKEQFLTEENKHRLYRFPNYKERLKFVEDLIKELM